MRCARSIGLSGPATKVLIYTAADEVPVSRYCNLMRAADSHDKITVRCNGEMLDMGWMVWTLSVEGIQLASIVVTAVATAILGYATWVLARETRVLSRATSQAHVTVTLEPNSWAINHVDIIVANSGNAVAYDIAAKFEPPLPEGPEGSGHRKAMGTPFGHISVLRPAQSMQSNLCEFALVSKRTYQVTVTWRHHPKAKRREELSYELSMMDYHDVSYLGARSPFTQMAEQIKKLREDWQNVARGSKRIKADVYSEGDREAEQKERDHLYREMRDNETGKS